MTQNLRFYFGNVETVVRKKRKCWFSFSHNGFHRVLSPSCLMSTSCVKGLVRQGLMKHPYN